MGDKKINPLIVRPGFSMLISAVKERIQSAQTMAISLPILPHHAVKNDGFAKMPKPVAQFETSGEKLWPYYFMVR